MSCVKTDNETHDFLLRRACEARREGRTDEYGLLLKTSELITPGHSKTGRLLLELAVERGEYVESVRKIEELVRQYPEDGKLRLLRADIAAKTGNYRVAADEYRAAFSLGAYSPEAYAYLAETELLFNGAGSQQYLEAMREMYPNHLETIRLQATFAHHRGEQKEALSLIATIVHSDEFINGRHFPRWFLEILAHGDMGLVAMFAAAALTIRDMRADSAVGFVQSWLARRDARESIEAILTDHLALGTFRARGLFGAAFYIFSGEGYGDAFLKDLPESNADVIRCFDDVLAVVPSRALSVDFLEAYDRVKKIPPRGLHCSESVPLAITLEKLGDQAVVRGDTESARHFYSSSLLCRFSPGVAIKKATTAPGATRIEKSHLAHALSEVRELKKRNLRSSNMYLETNNKFRDANLYTPFARYAYSNEDCSSLMKEIVELMATTYQSDRRRAPHIDAPRKKRKIRVGYFNDFWGYDAYQVYGKLMQHLPRDEFEVFMIRADHERTRHPELIALAEKCADHVIVYPRKLRAVQDIVASLELDILHLSWIMLLQMSTCLAYSRLARVQCTFGPHCTYPAPELDYRMVFSETDTAVSLGRLHEIAAMFDKWCTIPDYSVPAYESTRFDKPFGAIPQGRVYFLPQQQIRIHPSMSELMGKILRRDQQGYVFLASYGLGTPDLYEIIFRENADVADRIIVSKGAVGVPQYRARLSSADALLDGRIIGCGMNAYEALLQGRPMITWPNELFTGRILFGLYKIADSKLLLDNLVARNADEYAEKAVTLANDKALAKELSEEIVRCLPRIFGPEGLLEPIVSFYKMALERADAGLSPADWYHGQWMTRKDLLLHVDER